MGIWQWIPVLSSWLKLRTSKSHLGHNRLVICLRRAGYHSVWAPACEDKIAGGHAVVRVVSLDGALLSLHLLSLLSFRSFSGWAEF